MVEKKILIDEDELNYEGLFDLGELYALVDEYIALKGYDKHEFKNEEAVYPSGKTIHIILQPTKWVHTDYVRKVIRVELHVHDLKDIETEVDKVKVNVHQGKVNIKFSGVLETDYEGRWEQRPIYFFLRTIFEKYIYRGDMKNFEDEIISEVNELKEKVGSYLNLNRFRKAI